MTLIRLLALSLDPKAAAPGYVDGTLTIASIPKERPETMTPNTQHLQVEETPHIYWGIYWGIY